MMSSDQSAEIWYLDRSLQWHYLTNSFKNYYRLLITHLGLPQWQMLFTEDGLQPFLYVLVTNLCFIFMKVLYKYMSNSLSNGITYSLLVES